MIVELKFRKFTLEKSKVPSARGPRVITGMTQLLESSCGPVEHRNRCGPFEWEGKPYLKAFQIIRRASWPITSLLGLKRRATSSSCHNYAEEAQQAFNLLENFRKFGRSEGSVRR
jgi:hypothetical protein